MIVESVDRRDKTTEKPGSAHDALLKDAFGSVPDPQQKPGRQEVDPSPAPKFPSRISQNNDGSPGAADKKLDVVSPVDGAQLTKEQVKAEATKIEKYLDDFLSGTDEKKNFQAFSDELNNLVKTNGLDATRSVLKQIKNDNDGLNPLRDNVWLEEKNGSIDLHVFPSVLDGLVLLNYRDIGAIISKEDVFTSADTGRLVHNHLTDFRARATSNPTLDFSAEIYR